MEELTYQSLAEAMTRCFNNSHYQVCVVFNYTQSLREVMSQFKQIDLGDGVEIDCEYNPRKMSESMSLRFNRTSYMRFVCIDDLETGQRKYNEILYESGIDKGYVNAELYPMLVTYKAVDGSPYATELELQPFDEELLDYLGGFKITDGGG